MRTGTEIAADYDLSIKESILLAKDIDKELSALKQELQALREQKPVWWHHIGKQGEDIFLNMPFGLADENPMFPAPVPASEGWISVKDRFPAEADGAVAVLNTLGEYMIAWAAYWHGARTDFYGWVFPSDNEDDEDESGVTITHWMPLPAAPKEPA